MPRPVALLDVDSTLIFNLNDLNFTLINSLKSKGIKDVYLFTDMTLTPSVVKERQELVIRLVNQGLKVHGVITPCDPTWAAIPENITPADEEIFVSVLTDTSKKAKSIHDIQESDKVFIEEFQSNISTKLREMAGALVYSPEKQLVGVAYESACKELSTTGNVSEATGRRGFLAKGFTQYSSQKKNYEHDKGLMLDHFIQRLPNWVSSIVVLDDSSSVNQCINNFKPVTPIQDVPMPPLTMIPVTSQDLLPSYYEQKLQEHLDKDPIVPMIKEIDDHIKKLSSGFKNKFLKSPKEKIEALGQLKQDLLQADLSRTSVAKIIDNWSNKIRSSNYSNKEVSMAQIISMHRNPLKSTIRPDVLTNSQIFLNDLKKKYGEMGGKPEEGQIRRMPRV